MIILNPSSIFCGNKILQDNGSSDFFPWWPKLGWIFSKKVKFLFFFPKMQKNHCKITDKGFDNALTYLMFSYLRKTFSFAAAHTKPDIVIFLGDLMDEGSQATPNEYRDTYYRFLNIFSHSPNVKVQITWQRNEKAHWKFYPWSSLKF